MTMARCRFEDFDLLAMNGSNGAGWVRAAPGHQVVVANPIADHALPLAVNDQRELKFGMVVPIERISSFDPFEGSK
jgi:hypothetical protein